MVHHRDGEHHHDDDHEYGHGGYFTGERGNPEIIIASAFLCVMFFTAIVGNVLVILSIKSFTSLRDERFHLFLINLAITDLMTALFIMTSSFVTISMDYQSLDVVWCCISGALNYVLITVSLLTMAGISIVRFIAIAYPTFYRNELKSKHLNIMISFTWLVGFIFAIPPIAKDWIAYDYWEGICAIDWHKEYELATYYIIVACGVCFCLPALTIIFMYSCILIKAKRSQPINSSTIQMRRTQHLKKIFQILLFLVISFFVCMTPYFITKLLKVIYDVGSFPKELNLFASLMQYMASVINPFIYVIVRQDFRTAFNALIHKYTKIFGRSEEESLSNSRTTKINSGSSTDMSEVNHRATSKTEDTNIDKCDSITETRNDNNNIFHTNNSLKLGVYV